MLSQLWNFIASRDWADTLIAGGTIVLAAVTALLAWYTKRLADVTIRPSVVATLEPSRWSHIHFDLHVENEGTAAAFDIRTTFTPPIDLHHVKEGDQAPLKELSILRAGQRMTSFVTSFEELEGKSFRVEVSWSRKPNGSKREAVAYNFDMRSFDGVSTLGKDPAVQVAEEIKKLRELVQRAVTGSRISVNIYSSDDRERAQQMIRERRDAQRAAQETAGSLATPDAVSPPRAET